MSIETPTDFRSAFLDLDIGSGTSFEDANERLLEAGLGDGLPLVPPTPDRIGAFLSSFKTDPDAELDAMLMPSFMRPTLWEMAINAVMAGARPEYMPVIVAAIEAMADDDYNLLGIQATTGSAAPVIAVHGPIAAELGVNGAGNCLGQGSRANATIGRAVRLVLQNVGGANPGVGDMATMGQPGKYTWCFAENDAQSPLPPFHVEERGMSPGSSAVTVFGAAGSSECVLVGESGDEYAASYSRAMSLRRHDAQALVLLPTEAANLFFSAGFDRARWREAIFASAGRHFEVEGSAGDLLVMVTGGIGIKGTFIPSWNSSTRAVTREIESL